MTEFKTLDLLDPRNDLLNQASEEVAADEISSPYIQDLIRQLKLIANGEQGNKDVRPAVGMSAPQAGVMKRIALVDQKLDTSNDGREFTVLINPVILSQSEATEPNREGCFSCGNVCGVLPRSKRARIQAYNEHGELIVYKPEGFLARVFLHELDHLDGIRFPDLITDPKMLHHVPVDEFDDYRTKWRTWDRYFKLEDWQKVRRGELSAD